jgi:hypothetical protein
LSKEKPPATITRSREEPLEGLIRKGCESNYKDKKIILGLAVSAHLNSSS